jgi:hypothetical protein
MEVSIKELDLKNDISITFFPVRYENTDEDDIIEKYQKTSILDLSVNSLDELISNTECFLNRLKDINSFYQKSSIFKVLITVD